MELHFKLLQVLKYIDFFFLNVPSFPEMFLVLWILVKIHFRICFCQLEFAWEFKKIPTLFKLSFIHQDAPVGLHVLEIRDTSVVVLWEPPAFNGRTPVNGYYLDVKEASAGEKGWKAAHEKANKMKYMKVRTMKRLFCRSFYKYSGVEIWCMSNNEECVLLTIAPFDCSLRWRGWRLVHPTSSVCVHKTSLVLESPQQS